MVFSSLLFVFLFFAANIVVQALVPGIRKKNIVMLAFSLVFYAWAGPKYVLLLLGMTFICWAGGMYIAYRARTSSGRTDASKIPASASTTQSIRSKFPLRRYAARACRYWPRASYQAP